MLNMLSLAALSSFKAVSAFLWHGIAVCACVQHHEQACESECASVVAEQSLVRISCLHFTIPFRQQQP